MFMQNWLVAMPRGSHPIPFRIRSLSPSGPMVVIPQGIVRVGRRQPLFSKTAARKELPFSFSVPQLSDSSGDLPQRHPTPSSAGDSCLVPVLPPIPRNPAGGVGALAPRHPLASQFHLEVCNSRRGNEVFTLV